MNNTLARNKYDWGRAFAYGINTCLILALIMSIVFSIASIAHQEQWLEFIWLFIGYSLFLILLRGVINMLCLIKVGILTIYVLNKLNLSNPLNTAVIGALSVYVYIVINSEATFDWSFMIFIFYGYLKESK